MNAQNQAASQTDRIEPIADLSTQGEEAQNADQVKGGFNPQPDPPKIAAPVFRPPAITPLGVIR